MNISDPITLVLSIILCLFIVLFIYGWNKNVYNLPPGPWTLPIIGNLHILDRNRPYLTMHQLSKKFGPMYTLKLGEEKVVVICGYDAIKDALVNHADEFSGRPNVPIFREVTKGHGVIFTNYENWKVMRRFTLSTLRDFGMGKQAIENKISEESDFLVTKFRSYKGEPFDNILIINAAVANIIVSILLSNRFDYEDPTLLKLLKIVNENIQLLGTQKAMEKPNPGLYFTNENLTVLVSDLFSAGMETTSTTLRWGLLLMMKYPEIQKKVQSEIERVIGLAEPQVNHRKDMPYTDAVINEIQRFGNIVPTNVPHATTQDVNFRGYLLPKGTHVIPLLTSALYDKDHFVKADEFYPEHFLDSSGNFVRKEAFIPFSAGKRSCAGENLAKMELFMFFTKLLQNFTFQAPLGATLDLNPRVGFTASPKAHKICAIPRK
ncbi:cytochrome P450 2K6-like isoform X2 [Ranitomeya imitator]|uniref:cytochrome P450 2K6-like isoform X2 n=1 Tax=Ranitomeya imitator TaxID=111125 RepID=UPI0037E9219D